MIDMNTYYIVTLVLLAISFLSIKASSYLIILSNCFFLLYLPSTGWDYDYYSSAFENAYYIDTFPWFVTESVLTAEPMYIFYSSIISLSSGFTFQQYLVFNYLLCLAIIGLSFYKKRIFHQNEFHTLVLLMSSAVFPTIFYFSPRSSISFCLIFSGFIFAIKNKKIIMLLLLLLGVLFHSQYIPVALLIFFFTIYLDFEKKISSKYKKYTKIITFAIVGTLLLFIILRPSLLQNLFSVIPGFSVTLSKLHYLEEARKSIRLTSILSIVIFPCLLYFIYTKRRKGFYPFNSYDQRGIQYTILLVFFGMFINIVFFTEAHVAGRLSRFSDYFLLCILVPFFLMKSSKHGRFLMSSFAIFAMLVAPLTYKTLYNINIGL